MNDEDVPNRQAISRRLLLAAGCRALFPLLGRHFGSRDRTILGKSTGANRSAG
jgi:hypothetical protein